MLAKVWLGTMALRARAPLLLVGGVGWWAFLIGGLKAGGTTAPAQLMHIKTPRVTFW